MRRQLRPLERQADAARRHGDVVAELQALRIHVAGRELAALRARARAARAQRRVELASRRARRCKAELAELDTAVMATEAKLTAMGGDDLGDSLAQFESLFEQARGLGVAARRAAPRHRAGPRRRSSTRA